VKDRDSKVLPSKR